MHICIYTYIYIYIYIYIHIYMYMCVCVCVCVYILTYIYIYICVCICIRVCVYVCVCICTHTHTYRTISTCVCCVCLFIRESARARVHYLNKLTCVCKLICWCKGIINVGSDYLVANYLNVRLCSKCRKLLSVIESSVDCQPVSMLSASASLQFVFVSVCELLCGLSVFLLYVLCFCTMLWAVSLIVSDLLCAYINYIGITAGHNAD